MGRSGGAVLTPWVIRDYNDWMKIGQQLAGIFDGSPFQVTVKRFKRSRTLTQNARLHAAIRDLAIFTGYTEPQMKDIIKAEFCPIVQVKIGDREVNVPKPTSGMTVEEMSELIERLNVLAQEIGCVLQG